MKEIGIYQPSAILIVIRLQVSELIRRRGPQITIFRANLDKELN